MNTSSKASSSSKRLGKSEAGVTQANSRLESYLEVLLRGLDASKLIDGDFPLMWGVIAIASLGDKGYRSR